MGDAPRRRRWLLDEPFGDWHVDTATQSHQLKVTKKLEATVRTTGPGRGGRGAAWARQAQAAAAARERPGLLVLGISDDEGRIKPSRQAKYRQVEEFLRLLDSSITEAIDKGHLRCPTVEDPLRVVDLGCGNAYLTFAAERYLGGVRRLPVRLTGVDVKEQSREHNTCGRRASSASTRTFVVGSIGGVSLDASAGDRARAARMRHRDRSGAGAGGGLGRPARARRTLLPPRHRRPAAQGADPRAVRHADPARDPA